MLISLCQSTSTHISDHIHQWRRCRNLIKAQIPNQFLMDWFVKSLLPPIARDVAMGGVTTKEQAIPCAQYLDLVYYGVLYDIIKDSPQPSIDHNQYTSSTHAHGVVSSLNSRSQSQLDRSVQKASQSSKSKGATTTSSSSLAATLDVNDVQSSKSNKQPEDSKKKGKDQNKSSKNQEKNTSDGATKPKVEKKVRYPCLFCGEDHFSWNCPYKDTVHQFIKGGHKSLATLTNPFFS